MGGEIDEKVFLFGYAKKNSDSFTIRLCHRAIVFISILQLEIFYMIKYIMKKSMSKLEYLIVLSLFFIIGVLFGMQTLLKLNIKTGSIMGPSMENTLYEGTRTLYISKEIKPLKRGDIIYFYAYSDGELINVVKRVIGLPGETILIKEDNVYINEELLEEPYALYTYPVEDYIEIELKQDEYFVLGDNRCHSSDSRYYGAIPKKNILGVLIKTRASK